MSFAALPDAQDDPILKLIAAFHDDPRPDKVDLGVGVYRDEDGRTPVMRAVKAAERRLWEAQETKAYLGLLGDVDFARAAADLALGPVRAADRVVCQTPGGSGALWVLFSLIRRAGGRLWMPAPTWGNHPAIASATGLETRVYAYLDRATAEVDAAAMLRDLEGAGHGDFVLLHGCCHNPTGADPDPETWAALAGLAAEKGFTPVIDLAYQGFGAGLEEDAAGLRMMAEAAPELLLSVSCSKNFGLYRDRAGALVALSAEAAARERLDANIKEVMRVTLSMPPDHGAATAGLILSDDALRRTWRDELEEMRLRMANLRTGLAAALRARANDDRFDVIARHRGMFSLIPSSPDQIAALRERHGVYMVGDGRINIAGLTEATTERVADAFLAAGL